MRGESKMAEEKQESKLLKILIPSLCALVLVACIVIFVLCLVPFEKKFEGEGYQITLNTKFTQQNEANYLTTYHGKEIKVFVSKETFENIKLWHERTNPEGETKEEYIAAALAINKERMEISTNDEVYTDGDLTYYEYESVYKNKTYFYRSYVFKTNDAFWQIQFGCENSLKENLVEQIEQFAKTIVVENAVA